jgi:hypothetical protein
VICSAMTKAVGIDMARHSMHSILVKQACGCGATADFKTRFPEVRVEEDRIFINDGPIWTSAGMTAWIDLILALIDNDLGPDAVIFPAGPRRVRQCTLNSPTPANGRCGERGNLRT